MYRGWLTANPPDALASFQSVRQNFNQIETEALTYHRKVDELLHRRAQQQPDSDTTPPMFQTTPDIKPLKELPQMSTVEVGGSAPSNAENGGEMTVIPMY